MNYDLGYVDLERKLCSLSKTRLAQKCYLCSRYVLLHPKCPGRTIKGLAEEEGFDFAQYKTGSESRKSTESSSKSSRNLRADGTSSPP